jgi:ectoine hydroxylase-related dioxygenase (phytanoyl-CoA dioxygenase family)
VTLESLQKFEENGYVIIPDALSSQEILDLNQAIDRDQEQNPAMWKKGADGRNQNANILLSCPEFDATIRNPTLWPLAESLMGEQVCFEEFSVMIREPSHEPPPAPQWHRDTVHLPEHPMAMLFLSLIYYLTDVDAETHCFGIVPENVETKRKLPKDLDATGSVPLYGKAGTAILFNAATCHAAVVRTAKTQRRTIHIYYGHRDKPPLGNHTIFPARLHKSADEATKRFYSRPNTITRLVHQNI